MWIGRIVLRGWRLRPSCRGRSGQCSTQEKWWRQTGRQRERRSSGRQWWRWSGHWLPRAATDHFGTVLWRRTILGPPACGDSGSQWFQSHGMNQSCLQAVNQGGALSSSSCCFSIHHYHQNLTMPVEPPAKNYFFLIVSFDRNSRYLYKYPFNHFHFYAFPLFSPKPKILRTQ